MNDSTDKIPSLYSQTSFHALKSFTSYTEVLLSNSFHGLQPKPTNSQLTLSEVSQSIEKNHILVTFPLFVISPLGKFKQYWGYALFIAHMYNIWIYPARLAFSYSSLFWNDFRDMMDLGVDIVFMTDIVLKFFSAFEDRHGKLVYQRLEIVKTYFKTWFLFDFITSIPFYWMIMQESQWEENKDGIYLFVAADELKFLSILRIFKIIRFYAKNKGIDQVLLRRFGIGREMFLILKFLGLIAVTIHISACIWFFLCKLQNPLDYLNSWIVTNNLDDPPSGVFEQYIGSVYFVITVLMSIGYGNPMCPQTDLEKTYFIITVFFALGMFGFIMSMCVQLFSNKKTEALRFFIQIRQFVETFTESLRISKILNWKMLFYFHKSTQFQSNNILHSYHKKLLKLLPLELQFEVTSNVISDFLEKFDFFIDKPKSFVMKIVRNLRPAYYSPGDEIYKMGDPSTFVYFVQNGRVVTCCEDNLGRERAQIYTEGTYFGEVDIIMNQERLDNCYAETELKLLKLDKRKLFKIFREYDDIKKEMTDMAFKRLSFRKTYRKPKSGNTSLLPRSYWIWRKNKDCLEASIEDAHLSQRRSTIRQSILEGSGLLRSRGSSPFSGLSANSKSIHRKTSMGGRKSSSIHRKATFMNIINLIGPAENDVEIEDGEIEKISKEKLAGLFKEECGMAKNRREIIETFGFLKEREDMNRKKKNRKLGPVEDLDEILGYAEEVNEVLKQMIEDEMEY